MFAACCEGVLPAVKLFWKWAPTIRQTAVTKSGRNRP
jgi:hypothetical protein